MHIVTSSSPVTKRALLSGFPQYRNFRGTATGVENGSAISMALTAGVGLEGVLVQQEPTLIKAERA
jgi:hypothetical protein